MKRDHKLPPLTPMQIDTLLSIYYGEVLITEHVTPTRTGHMIGFKRTRTAHMIGFKMTRTDGSDLSGRLRSLRNRKLIQNIYGDPNDQFRVFHIVCTAAGIEEALKHDA